MKKFLRSPFGATAYGDVKITWIRGRTPTLYLSRAGERSEQINLTPYTTEEKLHALFAAKGLAKKPIYSDVDASGAAPSLDPPRTRATEDLYVDAPAGQRVRARRPPRLRGSYRQEH